MPSLRRQARRRKPFIAPEQVGSDSSSSSPLPAAMLAKYYKGMPKPESLPCPRCESPDTKFCYYNNYKLSQPRYYCKSCKRYWTDGGSLLDVPIGGATRKKKRPLPESASASASASTSTVAATAMDEVKGFAAAESSLSMAADLSSILSNNDDELLAGEGEDWLQSSCSTGFVDLLLSGGVDPTEIFGFSAQPSFSAPTGELKSKNSCNYPTLYHAIIQEDNKIGGTNGAVFDF